MEKPFGLFAARVLALVSSWTNAASHSDEAPDMPHDPWKRTRTPFQRKDLGWIMLCIAILILFEGLVVYNFIL
jgi:hypothetical protein